MCSSDLATLKLEPANWGRQNLIVIAMLPTGVAPLIWRARWVQILAPIGILGLNVAYMVMFYPILR